MCEVGKHAQYIEGEYSSAKDEGSSRQDKKDQFIVKFVKQWPEFSH